LTPAFSIASTPGGHPVLTPSRPGPASPAPAGWRPEDTTINFEGGNMIYSFKTGQPTR
jgi:hypothetical protein